MTDDNTKRARDGKYTFSADDLPCCARCGQPWEWHLAEKPHPVEDFSFGPDVQECEGYKKPRKARKAK